LRLGFIEQNVGKELAEPIYMPNGQIFANKGLILSEKIINHIKSIGIETVYISDENEDVKVEEIIPANIRLKIIKLLDDLFNNIANKRGVEKKHIEEIIDCIMQNINISENAFLLNNVGKKDKLKNLCQHSLSVAILSIVVGKNKNYDEKKITNLAIGALLHDVGKLFTQGEDHVKIGYDYIKQYNWISPISSICIYSHHENMDGSGYPEGIKGDKIYEFAKIVSIVNEYVRLTVENNMMPNDVLEIITSKATNQFDQNIYRDFIQSIFCYPNGIPVKLTNGADAVVVKQNKNFPTRPNVVVYKNGKPVEILNLVENTTLFIEKIDI
jgi:HD-GYP domain-containing protein (c-di-GMP phosphodiesterase class II)